MFRSAACGRRPGDGLLRFGWLGFVEERGCGERIASSDGFLISAFCLLDRLPSLGWLLLDGATRLSWPSRDFNGARARTAYGDAAIRRCSWGRGEPG